MQANDQVMLLWSSYNNGCITLDTNEFTLHF